MRLVPLYLLAALLVVIFAGSSMKKKGAMSESAYQSLVTIAALAVTVAALFILYRKVRPS